jgi:hypothetical protein
VDALLAADRFEVVAAGRDAQKLAPLEAAGVEVVQLDVRDESALAACVGTVGLVVNCVGPFIGTGAPIAAVVQACGAVYIDIASEQEHCRRLRALVEPTGSLVIAGAGAYPGLSGLLLLALLERHPGAKRAEMALIVGPPANPHAGGAQSLSAVIELAFPLQALREGELVNVVLGGQRVFSFPAPFGQREALVWPQLETLMLAPYVDSLETHVALGHAPLPPAWLLRTVSWLHPVPGSAALRWIARYLGSRGVAVDPATQNQGALVVSLQEGEREHRLSALTVDLHMATAWLPTLLAKRWADGELLGVGLVHAAQLLNPAEVLFLLERESVLVVERQVH